jgi:hypothetical protein
MAEGGSLGYFLSGPPQHGGDIYLMSTIDADVGTGEENRNQQAQCSSSQTSSVAQSIFCVLGTPGNT